MGTVEPLVVAAPSPPTEKPSQSKGTRGWEGAAAGRGRCEGWLLRAFPGVPAAAVGPGGGTQLRPPASRGRRGAASSASLHSLPPARRRRPWTPGGALYPPSTAVRSELRQRLCPLCLGTKAAPSYGLGPPGSPTELYSHRHQPISWMSRSHPLRAQPLSPLP
ncbi:hypothetical protein VULLAG_LOCUS20637 [Vulpes lagopus]